MDENAAMINGTFTETAPFHKTGWYCPAWPGVVLIALVCMLSAAAQEAVPVVPGRGTASAAAAEEPSSNTPAELETPKQPTAFPPVPGKTHATKGEVLWKGAAPDWESRALLFRMRDSNEPEARARALEMLPLNEAKAADLERLFFAAEDPQPSVQQAAWSSLDRCAEKDLFAYTIRTLAWGTSDRVRSLDAALPRLGVRLEKMMTATLETELETPRHRRAAAYCLGRSGGESAAPLLAKYARSEQGDLAQTCAVGLSMLRSPGALRDWEAMLAHQDATIRIIAVRALADLETQPAKQALLETAEGKREAGRPAEQEAVRAVGQWPDADSIPSLIDIMRLNKPLNSLAARLLHEKTGQSFGTSPEPWDAWLQQGGQKRGQGEVVQQQPQE